MKQLTIAFALCCMLFGATQGFSQNFGMPTIPTPQPATMPRYDNFGQQPTPQPGYRPPGQVQMGATSEDILRQANRNNPYYGAGSDPASIQRANEAWIHNQMMNDPAYNPALRNGVSNNSPINKQQELLRDLQDIVNMDNGRAAASGSLYEDYNSPDFAAKTKPYTDALQTLKDMLSGKRKMSIAEAYFTMENAYGEAYLTHTEFRSTIQQSADFIRQWMIQHNLNLKNNADINYAVQQFMGEELNIVVSKQNNDKGQTVGTISHKPFKYDFSDYTGDKDHKNFFVTKCLATGTGQCNSLPAVYLVLVEALGGKAYLAIAPQHSLVKYPDNKGNIRNYEPTSHWNITNEWYYDNMFVSKQAAMNKVYLSPWAGKQVVADIVLQLSFGYFRKYGAADGKLLNECVNIAKLFFPQNNNLILYFNLSNQYGGELVRVLRKNGISRLDDISKSPEAQKAFEKWQANEHIIEGLGYQDQPKDMYEEMMKYHEFRGQVQTDQHFDGKQKRSLFIKSNSTQVK